MVEGRGQEAKFVNDFLHRRVRNGVRLKQLGRHKYLQIIWDWRQNEVALFLYDYNDGVLQTERHKCIGQSYPDGTLWVNLERIAALDWRLYRSMHRWLDRECVYVTTVDGVRWFKNRASVRPYGGSAGVNAPHTTFANRLLNKYCINQ